MNSASLAWWSIELERVVGRTAAIGHGLCIRVFLHEDARPAARSRSANRFLRTLVWLPRGCTGGRREAQLPPLDWGYGAGVPGGAPGWDIVRT